MKVSRGSAAIYRYLIVPFAVKLYIIVYMLFFWLYLPISIWIFSKNMGLFLQAIICIFMFA